MIIAIAIGSHNQLAMRLLGLTNFEAEHMEMATDIATTAAFATDHGPGIMMALIPEHGRAIRRPRAAGGLFRR